MESIFEYTEPSPQELVDWFNTLLRAGRYELLEDGSIVKTYMESTTQDEQKLRKERRYEFAKEWLQSVNSLPAVQCKLRAENWGIKITYLPEQVSINVSNKPYADGNYTGTIEFNPENQHFEW